MTKVQIRAKYHYLNWPILRTNPLKVKSFLIVNAFPKVKKKWDTTKKWDPEIQTNIGSTVNNQTSSYMQCWESLTE